MPRLAVRLGANSRGLELRLHSIVAAVIAVGVLLVVWKARFILLLLFAGSIGALLLSELVNRLEQRFHMRRRFAYGVVLLTVATALGLIGLLRGPAILEQIHELQLDLPAAVRRLASALGSSEWGRWVAARALDPDQLSKGIGVALAGLGGAITATASIVGGSFVIGFVSLYLAAEPDRYKRGLFRLIPLAVRETAQARIDRAMHNVRYWILAKIVSMCAIGAFVTVGLWALQIPLAGTLGTLAALMTFIPNVGPLLSVLPAALLAFASSPSKGLMTISLFALAHFLEGNLVTPLAERNIVKLPPVLTLTMQLLLATLTGFAGLALAAPLTAAILGAAHVLLPPAPETSNERDTTYDKNSDVPVQS